MPKKHIRSLRLVLGDQLSRELSCLQDFDPAQDIVLMCEVSEEASYVPHHKQKLVFIFSAMRHFSSELQLDGITVEYTPIDAPDNSGSLTGEVRHILNKYHCSKIIVTEPGEWRVLEIIKSWRESLGVEVEIRSDTRFICSIEDFKQWAGSQKQLRMENFYRHMRKRTGWLMDNGKPVGGKWNYDQANRKALPKTISVPERDEQPIDTITREVIDIVSKQFPDSPGKIASFNWAVTRKTARAVLETFTQTYLENFGQFQDSMKTDQHYLFHAVISPYINTGLLNPHEVCEAVIKAGDDKAITIESIEGFIRQILGWREYVRGVYWLKMPGYADSNTFSANRPLPTFFWTADTELFCLQQSIKTSLDNAYAHHIQRLMVIGNFALLTGLEPRAVEEWYLSVYADAFEWVELPNTHGMVLYADEGLLASKPYAASGAYIHRMSDYCQHCHYNVKEKNGHDACPFNYLYWHFLYRNRDRLANNQRLAMPYRTLAKMSPEKKERVKQDAEHFLAKLK